MLQETVAFPVMSQRAAAVVQTNKYKMYLRITIYINREKGCILYNIEKHYK